MKCACVCVCVCLYDKFVHEPSNRLDNNPNIGNQTHQVQYQHSCCLSPSPLALNCWWFACYASIPHLSTTCLACVDKVSHRIHRFNDKFQLFQYQNIAYNPWFWITTHILMNFKLLSREFSQWQYARQQQQWQ